MSNIMMNYKGIDGNAFEDSVQIVKDTYRAVKNNKKFSRFRASFLPLTGVSKKSSCTDGDYASLLDTRVIKLTGLSIFFNRRIVLDTPLLRNLVILRHMLKKTKKHQKEEEVRHLIRNGWPLPDYLHPSQELFLSEADVAKMYAKYYFEKYRGVEKAKPNELTVSWYTAIVLTCIFYIILICLMHSFFPLVAIMLLTLHIATIIVMLLYIKFSLF